MGPAFTTRFLIGQSEVWPASVTAIAKTTQSQEHCLPQDLPRDDPKTVRTAFEIKAGMISQRYVQHQKPNRMKNAEGS